MMMAIALFFMGPSPDVLAQNTHCGAQASTFVALARYVATALRLSTPADVFSQLRREMVAKVISFDALRSFSLFEAPELRINEEYLRRTVFEFLVVLSIARGLFVRLEEPDDEGARDVHGRLRATLEATATRIERIAADLCLELE